MGSILLTMLNHLICGKSGSRSGCLYLSWRISSRSQLFWVMRATYHCCIMVIGNQMYNSMESSKQKTITQEIVKVNGDTAQKVYHKVKLLGRGGFASCYLTKNLETGLETATKVIQKTILANPRTKQKLETEIKIHKMLNCEYIVKLHTTFQDPQNVYMMMELCSDSNLADYLDKKKRFSVQEAQKFLLEISTGVEHLHSKGIIHRDIKLGNIFLGHQNKIKIGDFGLAAKVEFKTEKKRTICGTPNYLAPQIIQTVGYSYEVDIWSIGVMLFMFLVGTPPFQASNLEQTYNNILTGRFQYPSNVAVPEEAKELIARILNRNAAQRPTISQILSSKFMSLGKLTVLAQLATKPNLPQNQPSCFPNEVIVVGSCVLRQGLCYLLSDGTRGMMQQEQTVILPDSSNINVITRGKTDKIRRIWSQQAEQQISRSKLTLESVKFPESNHPACKQKFMYVRKYVNVASLEMFRMSDQTVHFKWDDGYYAIGDKTKRVWITNFKKDTLMTSLDQGFKEASKGVRTKLQFVKHLMSKP